MKKGHDSPNLKNIPGHPRVDTQKKVGETNPAECHSRCRLRRAVQHLLVPATKLRRPGEDQIQPMRPVWDYVRHLDRSVGGMNDLSGQCTTRW